MKPKDANITPYTRPETLPQPESNMKIGDVKFRETVAIFYYIADERVDFARPIKVFGRCFDVRHPNPSNGVLNQEAARIGGIGPCERGSAVPPGWHSFVSVSTSAARYQDISQSAKTGRTTRANGNAVSTMKRTPCRKSETSSFQGDRVGNQRRYFLFLQGRYSKQSDNLLYRQEHSCQSGNNQW